MSNLRDVLTGIYRQRGELTPQLVVDEAREETHPLHSRFEWDDAVAGEAYRRVQAAEIIRSVKIVFDETPQGEKKYIRAFSSLSQSAEATDRGYVPTEEIVQNDLSCRLLLQQLRRDVAALQTKYGHLEEFCAIMTEAAQAS
ncbi:hypothetical protein ACRAJ3_25330 [Rhodococcus pyridinivorans]|uniref:hypothetical protein n=1 Tax=Rhodococcus pyridinivorans TaxID=103816 RepID=UPI003D7FB49E